MVSTRQAAECEQPIDKGTASKELFKKNNNGSPFVFTKPMREIVYNLERPIKSASPLHSKHPTQSQTQPSYQSIQGFSINQRDTLTDSRDTMILNRLSFKCCCSCKTPTHLTHAQDSPLSHPIIHVPSDKPMLRPRNTFPFPHTTCAVQSPSSHTRPRTANSAKLSLSMLIGN